MGSFWVLFQLLSISNVIMTWESLVNNLTEWVCQNSRTSLTLLQLDYFGKVTKMTLQSLWFYEALEVLRISGEIKKIILFKILG